MSRLTLWVVNAALLVLAGAVTVWVVRHDGRVAASAPSEAKAPGRAERKVDRRLPSRPEDAAASARPTLSAADADVLWQATLFRPERTEDLSVVSAEEDAVPAAALDLELVGLARIGDRAVAVIVQHRGAPTRRVLPVGGAAGVLGRSPLRRPTPPAPEPASAPTPEGPPDRHVYKTGDAIGDSGYTLKEIRFAEKEVVLVRGSEERTLKLETADDQSSSRRESAAVMPPAPKPAPTAPPAAAAGGDAAAAATTPPPLPPPPAPGAPGAEGAEGAAAGAGPAGRVLPDAMTTSREERLERARLLRERLLQGRPPSGSSD
ncbi:MAG: hypothetical protein GX595_10455 [Lentisphaerae bacterium]|nr:hypothetical protein [Lentisphaerota bacterium]